MTWSFRLVKNIHNYTRYLNRLSYEQQSAIGRNLDNELFLEEPKQHTFDDFYNSDEPFYEFEKNNISSSDNYNEEDEEEKQEILES